MSESSSHPRSGAHLAFRMDIWSRPRDTSPGHFQPSGIAVWRVRRARHDIITAISGDTPTFPPMRSGLARRAHVRHERDIRSWRQRWKVARERCGGNTVLVLEDFSCDWAYAKPRWPAYWRWLAASRCCWPGVVLAAP